MSAHYKQSDNLHFKENERQERINTSLALNPDKRHFSINPNIMSGQSSSSSSVATEPRSSQPPCLTAPSSNSSSSPGDPKIASHPMIKIRTNHPNPVHSSRGRSTRVKPLNRFHPTLDAEFKSRNSRAWDLWISRDSQMRVENDSFNESNGRPTLGTRKSSETASYDDQWKSWLSSEGFQSTPRDRKVPEVEDDAFYDAQAINADPNFEKKQSLYSIENLEFQVPEDFFSFLRTFEDSQSLAQASTHAEGLSKARISPETSTLASTSNPGFSPAPRNNTFATLLPIMSRLPADLVPSEQLSLEEDLVSALETSTDYLSLPDSATPYTRNRLPHLDDDSIELWKALHSFRVINEDYSSGYLESRSTHQSRTHKSSSKSLAPHPLPPNSSSDQCPAFTSSKTLKAISAVNKIRESFNWTDLLLDEDLEGKWYGVAFRSARREGSESLNLYEADRKSHEEAVNSGGLMMYWYGSPSAETGENLATCIWTDRQSAKRASSLPLHAEAASHARPAYQVFDLTRYSVLKVKGEAALRIEMWEDDDQ